MGPARLGSSTFPTPASVPDRHLHRSRSRNRSSRTPAASSSSPLGPSARPPSSSVPDLGHGARDVLARVGIREPLVVLPGRTTKDVWRLCVRHGQSVKRPPSSFSTSAGLMCNFCRRVHRPINACLVQYLLLRSLLGRHEQQTYVH